MYEPKPLSDPPGAAAAALANHAWQNRLTIYAGAGISAAEPTFLPGADELARLIAGALRSQISLGGVGCDDDRRSAPSL